MNNNGYYSIDTNDTDLSESQVRDLRSILDYGHLYNEDSGYDDYPEYDLHHYRCGYFKKDCF